MASTAASGDRLAVGVAVAAAVGAVVALPGTLVVGAVTIGFGILLRRRSGLVVGVALLTSGLAAQATSNMTIVGGAWHGTVEVRSVTDTPPFGLRAEVRARARHLEVVPMGSGRSLLSHASPGDRLVVDGTVVPFDPIARRARGSHIAGRLRATRIVAGPTPAPYWRFADVVRGWVRGLGRPLPMSQRSLFNGFVLGDATGQSDLQQADFRASGLTHLLVASGENVAFVLVLFAPVLTRLRWRSRWLATIGVVSGYALVTGLEPSVLRAAAMAGVATAAASAGRPMRSWRVLGLGVAALVIADPFLVHSVSFGLSVGACVGIVGLARPLCDLLPGPHWVRQALGVTIGAQIGVAPILLGFPGGLPVATLPANLVAVVPAGLVMVLGLPALCLAATGFPGSSLAVWIPRILLGWVEWVAETFGRLPLGYLGARAVAVVSGGLAVALVAKARNARWLRRISLVGACSAMLLPALSSPASTRSGAPGLVVMRQGGTTIVVFTDRVPPETLLQEIGLAKVTVVDAVVVPHGDRGDQRMVDELAHRVRIDTVITPKPLGSTGRVDVVARRGDQIGVGGAMIDVLETSPVLTVHVVPSKDMTECDGCSGGR